MKNIAEMAQTNRPALSCRILLQCVCHGLVAAFLCSGATAMAQGTTKQEPARRVVCLPPFWGGVLAGTTRVEAVERLFGGRARALVHGEGSVSYTDARQSRIVTLDFLDNVVISLDVWEGTGPAGARRPQAAVSDWIKPSDGIGPWAALNVGATRKDVASAMGEPANARVQGGLTVWTYESSCTCELRAGFTFRFKDDRLVSFGIWHEAG